MPQVHVYIRNDDMDAWKALDNKSQFIHDALQANQEPRNLHMDTVIRPDLRPEQPPVINTPEQAHETVVNLRPKVNARTCPIHGTYFDYRGKCLQKDCKYGN